MTTETDPKNGSVSSEIISFKEKFAYGLGDFATGFSGITIGTFALYYYTDVIGVSATALGAILLFSRVFDAISNVVMGYIVDRTRSKHGKARAWILWSTIPFGLTLILAFSAPVHWSETALLIFAAISLNLHWLVYTSSNIPYGTLSALMTQDSYQRSRLNTFRMLSYFASMLILPYVTLPLVEWFGGGESGWKYTMMIYGLVLMLTFFYTFLNTKERVKPVNNFRYNAPSLKTSLKCLVLNRFWVVVFFLMLLCFSILGLINGVGVYYAKYLLGNSQVIGVLNLAFALPLVLVLLCSSRILRVLTRIKFIAVGLVVIIVGSAVMAISPHNEQVALLGTVLRGAGFAPIMGNAYSMLANTIDYGEWKFGIRNDGLVYSGGSFSAILGSGIASGGIGWILGMAGYIPGNITTQPIIVLFTLQILFIYVPIILSALSLFLLRLYTLEKIYPSIIKDLSLRTENIY
ncbi:MFS transporter [Escherichia coli]|nr:MFS transporter [Escherichia coli]EKZ5664974.1 MFS transporter [Klebsiella aerogenes]ELD2092664.1 MFS transporter [Enterobacter hormaechei]HDK6415624.1 MFS transporter [Klebsiella variicola]HEE0913114.1 MFS transporter [Klebsiella pneumoniae]